jgi:hypothetical protein
MGNTINVNNTVLGRSVIGKVYKTKVKVEINYCKTSKRWFISEWERNSNYISLYDDKPGTVIILVKPGFKFKVIHVDYHQSIEDSHHYIYVEPIGGHLIDDNAIHECIDKNNCIKTNNYEDTILLKTIERGIPVTISDILFLDKEKNDWICKSNDKEIICHPELLEECL